ncbi:hypothetical protein PAPYR_410 [Paratrimastix pyriformis]|uniref:SANT and BTB domain-containing protein n=1 Tax=Paratrimastix pyriformis TaxID=342808 RepID=A0ABQ8UVN2_9EUKA|nr:hypothetical protein PAPYR_410 [Paratrimastix pyriformis]
MSFFRAYLAPTTGAEGVSITVHCDCAVFEMLMGYIKSRVLPHIDVGNVVSLLISSEFLQMGAVVDVCLRFMRGHMADVLRLPLDMSCLNPGLLGRLADLYAPPELDELVDRRDKVKSRLFRKKVEALVGGPEGADLQRCPECGQVYPQSRRALLDRAGALVIGVHLHVFVFTFMSISMCSCSRSCPSPCVHVHVHVHLHVFMFTFMSISMCSCSRSCPSPCVRVHVHVHLHVFMFTFMSISMCSCSRSCPSPCVRVHVHVHVLAVARPSWRAQRCPKARMHLDLGGPRPATEHGRDPTWTLGSEVALMHAAEGSSGGGRHQGWRDIFWRLSAVGAVFRCVRCGAHFQGCHWGWCLHHPRSPVFERPDAAAGIYPCCGSVALRGGEAAATGPEAAGCAYQEHIIAPEEREGRGMLVALLERHRAAVQMPPPPTARPPSASLLLLARSPPPCEGPPGPGAPPPPPASAPRSDPTEAWGQRPPPSPQAQGRGGAGPLNGAGGPGTDDEDEDDEDDDEGSDGGRSVGQAAAAADARCRAEEEGDEEDEEDEEGGAGAPPNGAAPGASAGGATAASGGPDGGAASPGGPSGPLLEATVARAVPHPKPHLPSAPRPTASLSRPRAPRPATAPRLALQTIDGTGRVAPPPTPGCPRPAVAPHRDRHLSRPASAPSDSSHAPRRAPVYRRPQQATLTGRF